MNSGQASEWDGTIPSMPQVVFFWKYLMGWDFLFAHEKNAGSVSTKHQLQVLDRDGRA